MCGWRNAAPEGRGDQWAPNPDGPTPPVRRRAVQLRTRCRASIAACRRKAAARCYLNTDFEHTPLHRIGNPRRNQASAQGPTRAKPDLVAASSPAGLGA